MTTPTAIIDSDRENGATVYYVLERASVWRCDNPGGGAGVWTEVLNAAGVGDMGIDGTPEFCRIRVQGGKIYVICIVGSGSPYDVYVLRSASAGFSWGYSLVEAGAVVAVPYTLTNTPWSGSNSDPGTTTLPVIHTRQGDSSSTYNPWGWAFRLDASTIAGIAFRSAPATSITTSGVADVGGLVIGRLYATVNNQLTTSERETTFKNWLTAEFGAENSGWYEYAWPSGMTKDAARNLFHIELYHTGAASGQTWVFWNTPEKMYPLGFDVAALNTDWLYLGLDTKILKSEDGGLTWADLITSHGADDIRVHPMAAGCIAFWGNDGNLYQCIAGVLQPVLLSSAIRVKRPLRIAYNSSGGEMYVLAPTASDTFSVKKRNLATWSDVETGAASAHAIRCYQGGGGKNYLLYLRDSNIRYSADSGATWADKKGSWAAYGGPVNIHLLV